MSSNGDKPKVDKFAALAAAQQQKATNPPISHHVNNMNENGTRDVDMLIEDEPSHNKLKDIVASVSQERSSESTAPGIPQPRNVQQQQQQQQPHPPRRDKFASMAAAAETSLPSSTTAPITAAVGGSGDGIASNRTVAQRNAGNGKFAAALIQKQVEEQKQKRQRYIDVCTARDSVWDDCDTAEHAVTDLLKYAEQTTMLLSKNTTSAIHSDACIQSKEQLSKLINEYQSTVVQVHDLLAKHAHHVQAYKSNVQRHGEMISSNSLYTQRVEHRLAETKRRLIQDLLTSMKDEDNVSNTSM